MKDTCKIITQESYHGLSNVG